MIQETVCKSVSGSEDIEAFFLFQFQFSRKQKSRETRHTSSALKVLKIITTYTHSSRKWV